MPPVDILKKCTGLNTVDDPTQLAAGELQYAKDVVVTDAGRLSRADGFNQILGYDNSHSLFCDGGDCFFGENGSLFIYDPNDAGAIFDGLSGDRLDMQQYGTATYYCNGTDTGVIIGGERLGWLADEYIDTDSLLHFEKTIPKFEHICVFAGQMFGSIGNALYCSDPGNFGLFNTSRVHMFATKIIGIMATDAGLVISTTKQTLFLRGSTIGQFTEKVIFDYPMYEWSGVKRSLDIKEMGLELDGLAAFWNSPKGPCMATPDGLLVNLVEEKVYYPCTKGSRGASVLRGSHFITSIDEQFATDTNIKVGGIGSKATTQRDGFIFNSYCKYGEFYLACAKDGISVLGGNTRFVSGTGDVDITGVFETRSFDLGTTYPKGARYIYINGEMSGEYTVTPTVDDILYPSFQAVARKAGQQTIRKTISRKVRGTNWRFRVECSNDFSIDTLSILPKRISPGRYKY